MHCVLPACKVSGPERAAITQLAVTSWLVEGAVQCARQPPTTLSRNLQHLSHNVRVMCASLSPEAGQGRVRLSRKAGRAHEAGVRTGTCTLDAARWTCAIARRRPLAWHLV